MAHSKNVPFGEAENRRLKQEADRRVVLNNPGTDAIARGQGDIEKLLNDQRFRIGEQSKDVIVEKRESGLSPEKREFLKKPEFKKQHKRSIGVLTSRGLLKGVPTEDVPDDEQSLSFLAELDEAGEIDLDKIMALDKKGLQYELVVSPEELTPEEMQALKERKNAAGESINDFDCWDPSHPIFHGGKAPEAGKARRFRVDLIAAGADSNIPYLPSEPGKPESDHFNNGKNYDSSRRKLRKDKMNHPTPAAHYVLNTGKLLEDGKGIDEEGVCVLDMGERENNPLFPVGGTSGNWVYLNRYYSVYQLENLRVRPAGGGVYVPKKKS